MRYCLMPALALLASSAGGCNLLAWPLYVVAQRPTKNVPPEFDGLKGKHVALVIHAGPGIQLDYPAIQLEISDAVGAELKERLKPITLFSPRRVIRYQMEDPRWDAILPEKLCTKFDCDYVLLISLIEFSAREPESMHLARGRLRADAKLYGRPDGPKPGRQWELKEPILVMNPPAGEMAIATPDSSKIRYQTERLFAQALVKKFYKHKVEIEP